jgi:hypothetical protein
MCGIKVLLRDTIIHLMHSGYYVSYIFEYLLRDILPIQIIVGICGPQNKQR